MLAQIRPFPENITAMSRRMGGVDYSLLRTTAEGLYSTLTPDLAPSAVQAFRKACPILSLGSITILDGTAFIGGDAINLAVAYPGTRITAVEKNPDALAALRHNVGATKTGDQIEVVEGDTLEYVEAAVAERRKFDVLYLDPPCGGPDVWKKTRRLVLRMGDAPVWNLISRALGTGVAKSVVLKAPFNFDDRGMHAYLQKLGFRLRDLSKIPVAARGRRPAYYLHVVTPRSFGGRRAPGQVFQQVGKWLKEGGVAGAEVIKETSGFLARHFEIETAAGGAMLDDVARGGFADGAILANLLGRLTPRGEPIPLPAEQKALKVQYAGGVQMAKPTPATPVLYVGPADPPSYLEMPGAVAVARGAGAVPDIPVAKYSLVFLDCVLNTVPDVQKFLLELRTMVAPGGILMVREFDVLGDSHLAQLRIEQHCRFLTTPEAAAVLGGRRPKFAFERYRKHVVAFLQTKNDWVSILASAGLSVIGMGQAQPNHKFTLYLKISG